MMKYEYKRIEDLPRAVRTAYDILPFTESKAMTSSEVADKYPANIKSSNAHPACSALAYSGWARFVLKNGVRHYYAVQHRLLTPQVTVKDRKARKPNGHDAMTLPAFIEELQRVAASVNALLHAAEALSAEHNEVLAIREAIRKLS